MDALLQLFLTPPTMSTSLSRQITPFLLQIHRRHQPLGVVRTLADTSYTETGVERVGRVIAKKNPCHTHKHIGAIFIQAATKGLLPLDNHCSWHFLQPKAAGAATTEQDSTRARDDTSPMVAQEARQDPPAVSPIKRRGLL